MISELSTVNLHPSRIAHNLSVETIMQPKMRDNFIYLAVGLGIAALVVVDAFYADSHGRKMWVPSWFSARLGYTTALLAYFIVRETRRMKATTAQVLAYATFGCVVHVLIIALIRQTVNTLPGVYFSSIAVFELFAVWLLTLWVARWVRSA